MEKTPIEELIEAIREDGTRDLDGNLEVNLGNYDLDAYIRMDIEHKNELQAKHKKEKKQAVIKAYQQGYDNSIKDMLFEQTNKVPNFNTITAEQYYETNH